MKVQELFKPTDRITFEDYLSKCGVANIDLFKYPTLECLESPLKYKDMEMALSLINDTLNGLLATDKLIYILKDSDLDGLISTVIATKFLLHIGIPYDKIKILNHTKKGHGLTDEVMEQIKDDCFFLWMPDAGSNDVEQCKLLNERNIPVLQTDHHTQNNPNPYAIVVNCQLGEVGNKALCGAGVTYKLVQAYCESIGSDWHTDLWDLVALANVADTMAMTTLENRFFNYYGFGNINNTFLIALFEKYAKTVANPTSTGWSVAPKLNAVIRSSNYELKQRVFEAFVFEGEEEFEDIIKECSKEHRNQKKIVEQMTEDLIPNIDDSNKVIIAFAEEANNYIGLVANKLSSSFNKPILLVSQSNKEYRGSCRSPIDFKDILNKSNVMTVCDGHDRAFGAGWNISDTEYIKKYINEIDLNIGSLVTQKLNPNRVPAYLFSEFDGYEDIWGQRIEKPLFYIPKILIKPSDISELGNSTIKFNYKGIEYIKFFCSKVYKEETLHFGENVHLEISLTGNAQINRFRDKETNQILINDMDVQIVKPTRTKNIW